MYEGHFQLERRPFAATPDPGCCYLSPTHGPLMQTVGRCIDHGQGVAILTGPAGIGKTLLAQVLLSESQTRFTGVYLGTGQFPTRRALLQAILYELGQPYGGMTDQELRLELNTSLRNLITQMDGLLLVLDEAHLLSDRLLEEVRMIADLAQHGVPLTRVVLSGNPEFEERLTSSTLAAFNQRVACHVVLETLTRPESIEYLLHRIEWAGGIADRLFEREAMQLIADASDGVPRCLNQLADHSLMQAFLAGHTIVTSALVRKTLADLQHLPLRWNPSALHERVPRQTPTVTTVIETFEEPQHTATAETIEIGDQDESSTCSFEFGAGDGEAHVEAPQNVVPEPTIEPIPHESSTNSTVIPSDVPQFEQELDVDVEMEDGPPLFAWLAKAPAADASVPSEDSYSTSSFTIKRRGFQSHVVEQEVVNSNPLSGPELQNRRLLETSRPTTTIPSKSRLRDRDLPREELVVDQYASLDSQLSPVFPLPAVGFPEVSIPSNVARPTSEEVTAQTAPAEQTREVVEAAATEVLRTSNNPLEQIDAICTLLDSPFGAMANGGVELITDFGVERIDVDLPSQLATGMATPEPEPFDLEDWIGSTVLEVGRNVQRTLASSFPELVNKDRATKIEQLLDGIERATRRDYDIVEPDRFDAATTLFEDRPSATADFPEEPSGVVPPPKHGYKNFFSMLRRRQPR